MDGDPAVESGLDSFSRVFPLPYRVAFVVVLGVWGWGANLHFLHLRRIDVPSLIRYPGRTSPSQLPHHRSTYRLACLLSAALAASILAFWLFTRGGDPDLIIAYDWLPVLNLAVLAGLFAIPLHSVSRSGRTRLLRTLRRVAVGGLAEPKNGKFGDILLADVLTSYAKILADLYVCLCMFLSTGGSATRQPDRACGGVVVVPLIMALPSLARFRQCLIEYLRVQRTLPKRAINNRAAFGLSNNYSPSPPMGVSMLLSSGSSSGQGSPRNSLAGSGKGGQQGWGGQHLANAAKYASAFPPIICSAWLRSLTAKDGGVPGSAAGGKDGLTDPTALATGLYRAWVLACLVNSLYSFYWDVMKDWDLTLLAPRSEREAPDHAFGLRRRLHVHRPAVYYAVIGLDLALRLTWTAKLSAHLDRMTDWEGGLFAIQLCEVFRRWVWIFFRVEAEWIRNTVEGLGADDILLGDIQGPRNNKYADED